jgi:hypothetical protein
MKTGYRTSKAPYEDIHFGDFVERYEGSGYEKVVWRPFKVMLKPEKGQRAYPMLKVDKIVSKNPRAKRIKL